MKSALNLAINDVSRIPTDRPISLLHGDLHASNIFVNNNELEGIIDWSDSLYGDPLFDLARFRMTIDRKIGKKGTQRYFKTLNLDAQSLQLEKLYYLIHLLVYVNWYSFDNDQKLIEYQMNVLREYVQ